jgi:heme-degrading monooxygenase HmoA
LTVFTFERYPVAPDRIEEFERAVAGLLTGIRSAPGALWAEGMRALDGAGGFAVAAEWRTDADADAWESSDAANAFAEQADVLLGAEITRRRFVSAG